MPITLTKAIEVLDLNLKESHKTMPGDVKDALNLAINCMHTVKFIRSRGECSFTTLFPDEAPEENPN